MVVTSDAMVVRRTTIKIKHKLTSHQL